MVVGVKTVYDGESDIHSHKSSFCIEVCFSLILAACLVTVII
jgi:hypothetical protein